MPYRPSAPFPDYYYVLGVPERASFPEIQRAYWLRATRRRGGRGLPLLNEAYEVLGDNARRERYDADRQSSLPRRERRRPTRQPRPGTPGLRRKLNWYLRG